MDLCIDWAAGMLGDNEDGCGVMMAMTGMMDEDYVPK